MSGTAGALVRVPDWPVRLDGLIEAMRDKPFLWGEHDCCGFAARAVLVMTGVDVFAPWRGYSDARAASAAVAAGGGVAAIADSVFGARVDARFAQRGDIVLICRDGRDSLAVCVGAHLAAPGERALVFLPATEALCAWRV